MGQGPRLAQALATPPHRIQDPRTSCSRSQLLTARAASAYGRGMNKLRRRIAGLVVASAVTLGVPAAAYGAALSYGFSLSGSQGSWKRVPSSSSSDQTLAGTDGYGGVTNVNYSCPSGQSPKINYRFKRNITAYPDTTIVTRNGVLGCQYNYASGLKWPTGKYYFEVTNYNVGQASVSGNLYAQT